MTIDGKRESACGQGWQEGYRARYEQLLGDIRGVLPRADAEPLEQPIRIGGHGVALLGGPGGDPGRCGGIVRLVLGGDVPAGRPALVHAIAGPELG